MRATRSVQIMKKCSDGHKKATADSKRRCRGHKDGAWGEGGTRVRTYLEHRHATPQPRNQAER